MRPHRDSVSLVVLFELTLPSDRILRVQVRDDHQYRSLVSHIQMGLALLPFQRDQVCLDAD